MQALEKAGISGDWDVGEGNASELLAFAGRAHDLIVVEQMDVEHDEPGWDVAEICAVSSGTPTLVVPCEGSFPTVGERIVVAWNGSREATTALHAAMPLIERAKHVTLLAGECKERFGSITSYPKLDILRYLERHAVEVSTRAFMASGVDAGPRMLELAEEMRCDLLVMGAYGHSAWRELFLGGATRHVLQYMTLPVLMGH
jgi:nucleotide-binding universal stress UspA family protein